MFNFGNNFSEFIDEYLNHDRHCASCNDKVWVIYCGGHVWDKCGQCEEEWNVDLATHVTYIDAPENLSSDIEVRDFGNNPKHHYSHENMGYRKKFG